MPAAAPRPEKRRRILAAAREICAERGFEATRMDEIASRAGVSKGTLYNFFASKEDLFIDTVLASYTGYDGLLPMVEDPSVAAPERLAALVESLARGFDRIADRILLSHQAWSVVLHRPAARERLFGALREIYLGYTVHLREILAAGIAAGELDSDLDVDVATATWIATFDGLLYRVGFDDPAQSPLCSADGVRACLGWLLASMRAVPGTRTAGPHIASRPRAADISGGPERVRRDASRPLLPAPDEEPGA